MSDLLNPANLIVLAVIAVGMFLDCVALPLRHTEELLQRWCERQEGQKGCCDGYRCVTLSYSDELLIGGMSCDGCAQNVANASMRWMACGQR